MENGERRSQSHSREYYWLGPDILRNTRGQYILVLLVALINRTNYDLTLLESGLHKWPVPNQA